MSVHIMFIKIILIFYYSKELNQLQTYRYNIQKKNNVLIR